MRVSSCDSIARPRIKLTACVASKLARRIISREIRLFVPILSSFYPSRPDDSRADFRLIPGVIQSAPIDSPDALRSGLPLFHLFLELCATVVLSFFPDTPRNASIFASIRAEMERARPSERHFPNKSADKYCVTSVGVEV